MPPETDPDSGEEKEEEEEEEVVVGCPAETSVEEYARYPVYIAGTDRRFVSIQEGIWGAQEGDEVVVCPGEYAENIDFKGKAIVLRSAAGPWRTVIRGDGTGAVVSLRLYEGPETVLEGFTITGGDAVGSTTAKGHGGGVYVEWGQPVLRHNVIVGNRASIAGGVYFRNAGAYLYNNIIAWNEATDAGGGAVCSACWGEMRYNTFYKNTGRLGSAGEWFWGIADLVGNVLVVADAGEQAAIRFISPRDVPFTTAYNLLWPDIPLVSGDGAPSWPLGEGWLTTDPLLTDPEGGDWSPAPGSPLIDAGPPDEQDPDGSRADLGVFGGPYGSWPW